MPLRAATARRTGFGLSLFQSNRAQMVVALGMSGKHGFRSGMVEVRAARDRGLLPSVRPVTTLLATGIV